MSAPSLSRTRQAQDYLAAVEHELADLPADDRSALLEDLAMHLDALAGEEDERDIAVRLGPPSSYAAELRTAAGLPARSSGGAASASGLRERIDGLIASASFQRALPALREIGRLVVELRPAWWVLRGYLLVLVPCLLVNDGVRDVPVPAPLGSDELGFVLVLAAVAASVFLGRRKLPRPVGVLVVVLGVVLVGVSIGVAQRELDQATYDHFAASQPTSAAEVPTERYPLLSRYGPVTDVLPFSADGTPLRDVLLFDQDGRPLKVGFQEWWADNCARVLDQPVADDGVAVPNAYPQSYVLDPAGVDIGRSNPRPADSCAAELPRPGVPLPTFPADEAPAPVAGEPTEPIAPAPGD
ncbi:hypothetical protein [Blastococcus sp. LR1]|uniref:HAAS signaling domain-containing protein n=1 Tax=Blastococcus sp. LR1 TaxID=2877000 RepID=UPI001CC9A24D|nr:hypothetical protein [Blastococcus sp. LR1]MCA0145814.1 hypothetical protein [Blastococcus sp. LR1]